MRMQSRAYSTWRLLSGPEEALNLGTNCVTILADTWHLP